MKTSAVALPTLLSAVHRYVPSFLLLIFNGKLTTSLLFVHVMFAGGLLTAVQFRVTDSPSFTVVLPDTWVISGGPKRKVYRLSVINNRQISKFQWWNFDSNDAIHSYFIINKWKSLQNNVQRFIFNTQLEYYMCFLWQVHSKAVGCGSDVDKFLCAGRYPKVSRAFWRLSRNFFRSVLSTWNNARVKNLNVVVRKRGGIKAIRNCYSEVGLSSWGLGQLFPGKVEAFAFGTFWGTKLYRKSSCKNAMVRNQFRGIIGEGVGDWPDPFWVYKDVVKLSAGAAGVLPGPLPPRTVGETRLYVLHTRLGAQVNLPITIVVYRIMIGVSPDNQRVLLVTV